MELFHEPMDGNAEFIRQSRPLPDESGVPLAGWFTVPMRAFAIKEVSQKHLGNAGLSRRSFRAKADVPPAGFGFRLPTGQRNGMAAKTGPREKNIGGASYTRP